MNDTLDNELREIEAQLANLSPIQMPDDMINRMEQAMRSWEDHQQPEQTEEKIVPFSQVDHTSSSQNRGTRNLTTWGVAAAIALMTSLTAVFMTGNSQDAPAVAENVNKESAPVASSSAFPVEGRDAIKAQPELSRNITFASNEGITYAGKNEAPFKVLRIEYTEQVVTKDKDGKAVVTKKPCVEHILVPVPVH